MPELIAIHNDHKDHRDQFEIITIHDDTMKSFAELDKKLPPLKKNYWQGQDLPFPILLDGDGKTKEALKISKFPTGLLIDPQGNLVGEAQPSELEAKLPKLPASKMWARNRGVFISTYWDTTGKTYTPTKLAEILKRWAGTTIEVDVDAVKAAGLSPDAPLPGILIGPGVTLRTIEQLLLQPHGLGLVPSTDDKTLRLTTKKPNPNEPASQRQKQAAAELTEQLDRPNKASEIPVQPFELQDEPLETALRRIVEHFDMSVAVDAAAMKAGTIKPTVKITGKLLANDLRKSLQTMLDPHGLTLEVFHDVVLIRPKAK